MTITYAIIAVAIISIISLAGAVTFAWNIEKLRGVLIFFVALAVGALFGDVFLHILPEMAEAGEGGFAWALGGIAIFFILERFLRWQHSHGISEETEGVAAEHNHDTEKKSLGRMILIGDGLHNIIDGIIIGAAFMVDTSLGIATTIAVALHEIPHEIADFGVLLHAGFSRGKALFYNFLSALTAFIGLFIAYAGFEHLESLLLPIAAGGFIYIAGSDLVPALHKEGMSRSQSALQFIAMAIGVALMAAMLLLE